MTPGQPKPVFVSLAAAAAVAGILSLWVAAPVGAAETATKPARPTGQQLRDARGLIERLLRPPNLTAEGRRRIAKLLGDLSNESWQVRERATAELSKMGPEAVLLFQPAVVSKDPEIAIRAKRILDAIEARAADVGPELNAALDVLTAAGDRKVVGMLIQLLGHGQASARYAAEYALRRTTGRAFGFSAYDAPADRSRAAGRWQQWWKANEAAFDFRKAAASRRGVHILVPDDEGKKLVLLSAAGKVLWSRVVPGTPYAADLLPNGHHLVAYSGSMGVRQYDRAGKEVWSDRKFGIGQQMVYDVRRLANGNTLIAYVGDGHVSEVSHSGKLVWQMKGLKSPGAAERLANGNTLICENHGGRVFEVNRNREVVWQMPGLSNPSDATKLANGNVLIAEWGKKRVIEVDRAGRIVWERACPSSPSGAFRLTDGATAINNKAEGVVLVGRDGKVLRNLLPKGGRYAKIRAVAAAGAEALRGDSPPK
jgi:hypothetical protein